MPKLGDPDSHKDSSTKVSFGDGEVQEEPQTALYRGKQVNQCPAGTTNNNGICIANPDSEASVQSKIKAATGNQWDRDTEAKSPFERQKDSFKRELPKALQDTSEVKALTKQGVKARIGGR